MAGLLQPALQAPDAGEEADDPQGAGGGRPDGGDGRRVVEQEVVRFWLTLDPSTGTPPGGDRMFDSSTDIDVLAEVLGGAGGRERAAALLAAYGSFRAFLGAPEDEQVEVLGRGAKRFLAIREMLDRARRDLPNRVNLSHAEAVFRRYVDVVAQEAQEVFLAASLNARNLVIRDRILFRGTQTSCPVHPREVFRALIQDSACGCILVHNHPSGDPEPSPEDLALTQRLVSTGKTVGIPVLDHVIIGGNRYVSLAERGAC